MKQIRNLLKKVYLAHQDGHDTVFIITGHEGFGKSNLLMDMIEEWGELTNQHFTIENVGLTPEQWINAIGIAENKIGIAPFDEAGDGLLSREAMSDFNKDMVKMYTVIRGKGLFTILVLPSFWYLDKFFRMHRVKGLFFVYNRGRVAFWNKQQIKRLILKGEENQDIWAVKPCFRDRFPKYEGYLLDDYLKAKHDKIEGTIASMKQKYLKGEAALTDEQRKIYELLKQGLNGSQIAKMTGKAAGTIWQHTKAIERKGVKI